MKLKYQHLLKELKIEDNCPPAGLKQINSIAYRWVFEPIHHDFNFLPNYEFDKVHNRMASYSNGQFSDIQKCSRCSQSLFNTLDAARINHNKLAKGLKEKLGYTHIAEGWIDYVDGYATEPNTVGHFSFYEEYGCDLKQKFIIKEVLV